MADWEDAKGWETASDGWEDANTPTTLGEDVAIGFANVGNTVDTAWSSLAGGLANVFNQKDDVDSIFKNLDERIKTRTEWANPKGKKQTFGGKVASAVTNLPMQALSFPLSPFQTGKTAIDAGESLGRVQLAQGVDTLGNMVGLGVPMGAPSLGPVVNTTLGFVGNAIQDAVTKDVISKKIMQTPEGKKAFEPNAEDAVVAGLLGAGFAAGSQSWKTPARGDFDSKLKAITESKKAAKAAQETIYVGGDKEATVGPSTKIVEDPSVVEFAKQEAARKEAEAKGTFYVDSQGRATKDLGTVVKEDPATTDVARDMQQQRLQDRAAELGKGTGETREMFGPGEQTNLPLDAPYRNGMGGMGRSQRGAINLPDIKRAMEGVKNKTVEPFEYLKLWRGAFTDNELGQAIKSLTNPKSRDTVVLMSPDDFHTLAAKRSEGELTADYTPRLRDSIKEGLKSREGLWEMPYLMVDSNNQVVSHEGRHRMDVFKEQGIDLVPVRLRSKEVPWSERKEPIVMFPQDAKNYSVEGKLASAIPAPSFIKGQEGFTFPSRGMGRSQRGAIDPDLLTLGMASKLGKYLDKAKAIDDLTGTKLYQEITDPEATVAIALQEGKDGRGINNLEAGATLAAAKRGSAAIQGASRIIQRAKNIAEDLIRTHVFPVESQLKGLKLPQIEQLAKVMKEEMFLGERFSGDELISLGLTEKQLMAYTKVRDMFDQALKAQNIARETLGLKPITPEEAYLSSRWQGDFRRAVFDRKGKLVWYLADHSKRGLDNQMKALLREFPDLRKGNSQDHVVRSLNTGNDIHSAYTTMLDILGKDNPYTKQIQEWYEQNLKVEGEKAFAQTKHFEEKNNVRGFVGDRPGRKPSQEALDMFQQQIVYAKNAFKWAKLQEAGEQLKTIVGNPELAKQQPNNIRYIQDYFAEQLGLSSNQVARAIDQQMKDMGISPRSVNSAIGTVKNLWITQKLAVNAGFLASNIIQAANVLPHLVDLQVKYGGNPLNMLASIGFALPVGTAMATGHVVGQAAAVRKAFRYLPLPNEFLLKMMKYSEDNSVTARSIYDESPIENTFSAVGKASNIAGKTISTPETFLRSFTFLTYATQLKLSGKFMDDMEVFRLAEEKTNISMGDYREGERAMIFNKMGTMGNAMNVLSTFPINYYNQWSWAARESMKGNIAPMLTMFAVQAMAAGAMGVPGFSDADKLINAIKDWLAEANPLVWEKIKDFDLKQLVLDAGGSSALYGAASTESGVGLTSRAAAPAGTDIVQNPVAPYTDFAQQGTDVLSSLIDPGNEQKRAQALLSTAPAGLTGYLETGPLRDQTSIQRGDERVYKTRRLADREGSITRTPQEESLRALGFRSQREVEEKDAAYTARKKEAQTKTVIREIPDKFYNAVRNGDMDKARDYMRLYTTLSGNKMSVEQFNNRIMKEYMTGAEKSATKAQTLDGMVAVKRLKELLAEQP